MNEVRRLPWCGAAVRLTVFSGSAVTSMESARCPGATAGDSGRGSGRPRSHAACR